MDDESRDDEYHLETVVLEELSEIPQFSLEIARVGGRDRKAIASAYERIVNSGLAVIPGPGLPAWLTPDGARALARRRCGE